MENFENLTVQFKSKLGELEQLFDAVVFQRIGKVPSEIIVGKNGSLIVRIGFTFWACSLSKRQCNFLEELLKGKGEMDRKHIKKWGINPSDDQAIRSFLRPISRKLTAQRMPLRLRFVRWIIFIELTTH